MIPQYRSLLDKTKTVIDSTNRLVSDDFLKMQMASFACILLSGALESLVKELLTNFAKAKSHPNVARYTESTLESFTNASPDKIANLLFRFDANWSADTEKFWDNEIKGHIGSVIGNRHLIAHGRSTSLTLGRVEEWRRSVVKLSNFFEQKIIFDNNI